MYDDGHGAAYDYGLKLGDRALDQLVVAPFAGVEWAAGDHWSVALLPSVQLLAGTVVGWELKVPLQLRWSWYL